MALAKPVGIASMILGALLLVLAFAVATTGGTAFAGETTGTATTGTPSGGSTGTPSGSTTGTPSGGGGVTTPTRSAGGISTPTPAGGGAGAASTPSTGGATTAPDTGTGPGGSDSGASLLWLLGATALIAGAGAVVVGTRQRG